MFFKVRVLFLFLAVKSSETLGAYGSIHGAQYTENIKYNHGKGAENEGNIIATIEVDSYQKYWHFPLASFTRS